MGEWTTIAIGKKIVFLKENISEYICGACDFITCGKNQQTGLLGQQLTTATTHPGGLWQWRYKNSNDTWPKLG